MERPCSVLRLYSLSISLNYVIFDSSHAIRDLDGASSCPQDLDVRCKALDCSKLVAIVFDGAVVVE